jgi:hypothetical protein
MPVLVWFVACTRDTIDVHIAAAMSRANADVIDSTAAMRNVSVVLMTPLYKVGHVCIIKFELRQLPPLRQCRDVQWDHKDSGQGREEDEVEGDVRDGSQRG